MAMVEVVRMSTSSLVLFIMCVLLWSCNSTHVLGQSIVMVSNDLQALQSLWKAWSATPDLGVNLAGWHSSYNNNSDYPCYNPEGDWEGISCIRLATDTNASVFNAFVINLELNNKSLKGTLPPDIGNFTYFVSLQLTGNPDLGGPIPKELSKLPLDWLHLHDNNFNGTIPEGLILRNLLQLNLSGNQLSGTYPMQFSSVNSLQDLLISRNKFSGEIPQGAFVNLTELQNLDISSNNFQGPLPNVSMLRSLTSLNLSNTGLTGSDLFNGITLPKALTVLDLSNTTIVGSSFNWSFLQNQTQLEYLLLDNNSINGTLDIKSLWTLHLVPRQKSMGGTKLRVLSLRNNNITGVVVDSNVITDVTTQFYLQGNPYCNTNSEDDSTRCYCKQICQITQTRHENLVKIIASTSCITGLIFSIGIFSLFVLLQQSKNDLRNIIKKFDEADVNPRRFDYNQLRIATKNFDEDMKVGAGAYGAVYKGILSNNTIVAVKRLFMKTQQASSDFTNEVVLITNLRHQNLVNLKGFCLKGKKMLLVYEYVDNYDLDKILFGSKTQNGQILEWQTRYKICLGVAHGLYYLHASTRPKIIHRDIKASNILLDKEFNPKIADFGLARPTQGEDSEILTEQIAGTKGYLAPEYAYYGQLSEKTDVYSFGVLLMEVISGRRNLDNSLPEDEFYLPNHAWKLHSQDKLMDLLDPKLCPLKEPNEIEVLRVIKTALTCIQTKVARRPTMFTVVSMLVGDLEIPILTNKGLDYPSNLAIGVDEMSESGYPSSRTNFAKGGTNKSPTLELAHHNPDGPNCR